MKFRKVSMYDRKANRPSPKTIIEDLGPAKKEKLIKKVEEIKDSVKSEKENVMEKYAVGVDKASGEDFTTSYKKKYISKKKK